MPCCADHHRAAVVASLTVQRSYCEDQHRKEQKGRDSRQGSHGCGHFTIRPEGARIGDASAVVTLFRQEENAREENETMPLHPTRRNLLKNAIVAAAAGVARPLHAAGDVSPITTALSSYMGDAGGRPLPKEVTERTKYAILDTFAAMISGSELPPGRFAIQFARAYKGERVATIAGSDVMCGPIEAALVNGMLAHSDETDDTHPASQSHPGSSVVPSAMAVR